MTTDLDPRWATAIRAHADTARPTPEAWAAITERAEEPGPDPTAATRGHRPSLRRTAVLAAAVLGVVLALATAVVSVARDDASNEGVRTEQPATDPTVLPTPETPVRVAGTATVLESPEHGPEACFGLIQGRLPPGCTGLPLIGWDWGAVEGEERMDGTTWGSFEITGDYDGERLAVTEPAGAPDHGPDPDEAPEPDFSTPCPEPDGGWVVRDRARLRPEDRAAVQTALDAEPDFGLMYMDRSIPVGGSGNERGVLNASFTGDLDRHRDQIEALWGGPVCVTLTEVSWDQLQRASHQVLPPDGSEPPLVVDGFRLRITSVSSGNAWQELQIHVEFEPPGAEAALTERLGVPVRLIPALRPTP